MGLDILIGNLRYLGFYDFFLPFVLFVAIIYGLLSKTETISDEPSLNGIIAISVSFFIINYTPLGMFFSSLFGLASIVLAGLLVLLLFGGMFGIELDDVFSGNKAAVGIGLLLLTIIVFLSVSTDFFDMNSSSVMTVALLFVMVLGVMMIGGNTNDS